MPTGDKVEAVSRQGTQDQLEIAKRVGVYAYTGTGGAGRIVAKRKGRDGAVGIRGANRAVGAE